MARRVDPTERTFLPYENVKHVSDCTAMSENSRRDRMSDGQAGGAGRFWLPGSGDATVGRLPPTYPSHKQEPAYLMFTLA
jgi:hypothetical protein